MQNDRFFDDLYAQMPWDDIDTVVFDIGNVLLRFDPEYVLGELFEDAALKEQLMNHVFASPHWLELDRGTLTYADAPRVMAKGDAALQVHIEHLLKNGLYHMLPIKEGMNAVKSCKAHGKRLCLLSNYAREAFEWNLAHYPIFSLFDERVISYATHQLKPEREIYETLLSKTALTPSRSVFIDDTRRNIEAAQAFGIQGIWYNKSGQLERFFR